MNYIYGMLLPTFFGIKVFEKLNKQETINKVNYCYYYLLLLLLSNLLSVFICHFLFNLNSSIEYNLNNFPMFSVKYIIINLILNFILAIIITVVRKNININIEISENNGKKNK